MFRRDLTEPDYSIKYFPKTDELEFMRDMFDPAGKTLQFAVLAKEERAELNSVNTNNNVLSVIALTISILPPVFMNKITLFDRFRSTWSRVLVRSFMFLTPLTLSSVFIQKVQLDTTLSLLNRYSARYTDWKMNGDIKIFGSHVKVEDSYRI